MAPPTVAEHLAHVRYAGSLEGADGVGEGARAERRLVVRVGLWLDARGAVVRARYRASSCAALIAYAEEACGLAERGGAEAVSPGRLRASVSGVHPIHHDRAELVALAFARARAGAQPRDRDPA